MNFTWFGVNTWLITVGQQRLWLDPWLVEPLVFGDAPWLFRGLRQSPPTDFPRAGDVILLSQGLADHTHVPTLTQCDRQIPILGSPAAAKTASSLGFETVKVLDHGDRTTLAGIEILTTPGAWTGPKPENGYVIRWAGHSIYYEPHGFFPKDLDQHGPIQVVISPVFDLGLPVVGAIIRGQAAALGLARLLRPQYLLPTAVGEDNVTYDGLVIPWLSQKGDIEALRAQLTAEALPTEVAIAPLGEPFSLTLTAPVPQT